MYCFADPTIVEVGATASEHELASFRRQLAELSEPVAKLFDGARGASSDAGATAATVLGADLCHPATRSVEHHPGDGKGASLFTTPTANAPLLVHVAMGGFKKPVPDPVGCRASLRFDEVRRADHGAAAATNTIGWWLARESPHRFRRAAPVSSDRRGGVGFADSRAQAAQDTFGGLGGGLIIGLLQTMVSGELLD